MLLPEQNTTKKEQIDKIMSELEFVNKGNGKYEIKVLCGSAVYTREFQGHLPDLYNLVSWKGYLEEENTWKPVLAIQNPQKLATNFYKEYPENPMVVSLLIDSAPPIARLTAKLSIRSEASNLEHQWDRPAKNSAANKCNKKT